eukprot:TRINITY_DN233_c0_g2_i1.p1 TRINITY_DN233_c0_g2~~TRINITY_DN233_c0_g2_i1.p1  ORF type:complete len:251 (+),score=50.61 TRINITY_DN233_c0_g2_i1:553-1305(+)
MIQFLVSEKQKKNDYNVFSQLLNVLKYSPMEGLKLCLAEFCKTLLDPDAKEGRNEFVDAFFDKLVIKLTDSLSQPLPYHRESAALSQHLILDVLTHSIKSHPSKACFFIVHSRLLATLEVLYRSPLKHIRLDMLRLFKAFIATKEELVLQYVVDQKLFRPIFALAKRTTRDNLLHSAILSLFDYIGKENIKTLLEHLSQMNIEELNFSNATLTKRLMEKIERVRAEDKSRGLGGKRTQEVEDQHETVIKF